MSLKSAPFFDETFFLVKTKTSGFLDYSLDVLEYQDFQIIRRQIKGILLYYFSNLFVV
jgi:hypothetical protein